MKSIKHMLSYKLRKIWLGACAVPPTFRSLGCLLLARIFGTFVGSALDERMGYYFLYRWRGRYWAFPVLYKTL